MQERDVFMAGIGSYSPGDPVPFDQIEDVLGRLTEAPPKILRWIDRMQPIMKDLLDIDYAYYALDSETREPTENNISMSVKAAHKALNMAGIGANDIDLLVYGGAFMESLCPPISALIQDALDIRYCAEMAIHSNCTSICKALQVASDLIANGRYTTALVLTSQISSAFLRAEYFNQSILTKKQAILRWFLSDGAGALVLTAENSQKPRFKILDTYIESVGAGFDSSMYTELLRVSSSNLAEVYEQGRHHINQDFKKVSELSPGLFEQGIRNMVAKTVIGASPEALANVKWFLVTIPIKHLMDICVKTAHEQWDSSLQFYTNLHSRGYVGPPSTFIALDQFMQETALSPGEIVVTFVEESSKWMQGGFFLEYCT
ncbi:hypothetical protein GF339_00880 [candidate division KSB3 bacterium]|uniref:Beta-ketoacyl-[acyl-carrier-protein] synthase III N-terminal domain-containing protein n=1 Tax=candidate division KSB3 bacterium TaxID=2044937 RepID=A0A9D5JRU7_9BACT|nr:hypothetical protein [candidate division KSB3 bacterium]MBD3323103.1 hypothetical protein [candidate division KSB3 bacterium]